MESLTKNDTLVAIESSEDQLIPVVHNLTDYSFPTTHRTLAVTGIMIEANWKMYDRGGMHYTPIQSHIKLVRDNIIRIFGKNILTISVVNDYEDSTHELYPDVYVEYTLVEPTTLRH